MTETQDAAGEGVRLAVDAARQLFHTEDSAEHTYEPRDVSEARAATRELGEGFERLPGLAQRVLDAGRSSGNLLSSDRLQGLSEIVQNADDVGASQVRLLLRPTDLLVSHDGRPVRLRHVLGLATPWLSTKRDEAEAIGRFGIGLMTLRSLSSSLEVHSHPYHVRLGGKPPVTPIEPPALPAWFDGAGWTTLRVPLEPGVVSLADVEQWLEHWDDAALLFLRTVSRVTLLAPGGDAIHELALSRRDDGQLGPPPSPGARTASRQRVESADGRSWAVYSTEVSAPAGVMRALKATDSTVPISVALPLRPVETGQVHEGLPVASTQLPLFVNAQFDPLASRRDFADSDWNLSLLPRIAELWSHAVLDLFQRDPGVAWHAMPIAGPDENETTSPIVRALEKAVVDRARRWVASHLAFPVHGRGRVRLAELAVEARALEGILTAAETAELAGLPAALPTAVRDRAGRWRAVLEDWRAADADLPEPVSVEQALELVGDDARAPDATIALAAAALGGGLGARLLTLPCVITQGGRRLVPPPADAPEALAASTTPLAEQLGVVTLLHPAHLGDGDGAPAVLAWLRESGALLDGSDDRAVVRRLAVAGQSGRRLDAPLADEQVQALRDAFESINPAERDELGADVGRAVSLEAYIDRKRRRTISARPADAYLPRTVDREPDSFAVAARETPGLVWLSGRYARVLRSPAGRGGIGALRFLRLLGAETAPRARVHPQLERRYVDRRKGLSAGVAGGASSRRRALRERDATYTLDDYDSPDLLAVVQNIARERGKRRRRERAGALLATLGRAWDRSLGDIAEVDAAAEYYDWRMRGRVRAFWLWHASAVAWLDDESGTARRPAELRVRTPGTEAIYGADAPGYLHRDLARSARPDVLGALGVTTDPGRSALVRRLEQLRAASPSGGTIADVAVVYRALSRSLTTRDFRPDLTENELSRAFERGRGLVLTKGGWLPPRSVLAGPPIFGDHRAFAPAVEGTEPLWRALDLREPSPDDCVAVIRTIARRRRAPDGTELTILLETLRALASHHSRGNVVKAPTLARLPLWTSLSWVRDRSRARPVYATNDRVLAEGLRGDLPLWEPGGELEQFRPLLGPLRVTELRTADSEVIEPTLAHEDEDSTELFRAALRLLHEDLARNDPQLAASVTVPWETLGEFGVSVHPSLELSVPAVVGAVSEVHTARVAAKVEPALRTVFVRDPSVLPRVEGGGRAIAALFGGDPRQLAQAWRAAWDQAEDGRAATRVELANERAQHEKTQNEAEIESRLAAIHARTGAGRRAAGGAAGRAASAARPSGAADGGREAGHPASEMGAPRVLVDPRWLRLLDWPDPAEEGTPPDSATADGTGARAHRDVDLAEPNPGSSAPRNRSTLRGYSALEQENVGLEILRMLLDTDGDEIVDLRAQRGVGADAIDQLGQFYELKVSAGAEPDQVSLTAAEVKRARTTPGFFLVVVSGIEGVDARPTVRVIVDPLGQLRPTDDRGMTLSGVRQAKSRVYRFATAADPDSPSGENE